MKKTVHIAAAVAFCVFAVSAPGQATDAELHESLSAIRPEALSAHVTFLADDLLEGRGNGTRGYAIAARYVAAQFQQLGLAPGPAADGFLQTVPLRTADLLEGSAELEIVHNDGTVLRLTDGEHFVFGGNTAHEHSDITAPVVFAGFGVTAPGQGYDDYAGLDVDGRIVMLMTGAPASFPNNERAYYSSGKLKYENAIERGAIGMISATSPADAKRTPWSRMVSQSRFASMRWRDADGDAADTFPAIRGRVTLSLAGATQVLAAAGIDIDEAFAAATKGEPQGQVLPLSASLRQRSRHDTTSADNVLAMLRGSDPALAGEYVIYTAHLDHLGIGVAKKGDSIYNGAYDNATGVAMLIETARAFARLPEAPPRSILFLATAGEERGLLGADYYARHPGTPIDAIVANVNLDMPQLLFEFTDVIAFGAQHSSLGAITERAANAVGLALSPDPFPEEVVFVRSDQYAFVRQGVPAVFLVPGMTAADGSIDGSARFREFLASRYHSPQDDLSQDFDWQMGARFTQANFLLGFEIAHQALRPVWNEGDFFGERFSAQN